MGADAAAGGRLRQHFLGQILQTPAPSFDTACPTLMDFRVPQGGRRCASCTSCPCRRPRRWWRTPAWAAPPLPPEAHRAAIADYARRSPGRRRASTVVQEEAGAIPMSARRVPDPARASVSSPSDRPGGRASPAVATRSSASRSSAAVWPRRSRRGRHAEAPRRFAPRAVRLLRRGFSGGVSPHTRSGSPTISAGSFGRVGPDALARFLSETSTWRDEWQVAAALPPGPFLRARLAASPQWLPHLYP